MSAKQLLQRCLAVLACAVAAGCGLGESVPPGCRVGIPAHADLLGMPELASLTFHRRANFDASRGAGFDFWADEKFDYKAALEMSHVRSANAPGGGRFCVDGLSLKLALPLDGARRDMLRAFVRSVAGRTAWKPDPLLARLDQIAANGEKYHPMGTQDGVALEAGRLSHATRGELFVVSFLWQ